MSSTLFILIFVYISAIIVSAVILTVLFVRSSRSAVYYGLLSGNMAILISLTVRLFEFFSPYATIRLILIHVNLITSAIILAFLFQLIYSLVTRLRPPLLLQMIAGAAALVFYVSSLTLLPMITAGYQVDPSPMLFQIYLALPLLLDLVFTGLMLYAIRVHQINMLVLSFARIMTVLPDTVFVFDKTGRIIDTNSQIAELSDCRDGDELSLALAARAGSDCKDLTSSIKQPGKRIMGEFSWTRSGDLEQIWVWSSQAVRNRRGAAVGSYLLLSDRTRPRGISTQLQRQNEELRQINKKLSDYSQLVGQYAEAATRHEVAAIIDSSVRQRLNAASGQLRAAEAATGEDQKARLQILISDCRQALADIRALVGRLAE